MKKWLQRFANKTNASGNMILQQAVTARAEEELKILHTDFSAAWQYFKENYDNYKGNYALPLYLIIGQSTFGKTTLLAKSGLELQDIYGNKVQNGFSTKYCVWLFSPQATFLDTAGVYSATDKDNPHDNLVWLSFLNFMQGHFGQNPFSGVVIVIDIPTLLGDKGRLQKVLNDAKERLYEMAQYVATLPVYVVFTKLDVLSGFTDFFADWSPEEQQQPFGITFAIEDKLVNPQQVFATYFTKLLGGLAERLKQRLQKEEDLTVCMRAQEFYGQFAALNTSIAAIFDDLPYGGHIVLNGCYFVSSLQDNRSNSIDIIMNNLSKGSVVSRPISHAQFPHEKHASKSYFVEGLFKQIILANDKDNIANKPNVSWLQVVFVLVLAVCLGVLSSIWYVGFAKSAKVFGEIEKVMQNKPQTSVAKLERAINVADVNNSFWWAHVGLSHVQKLKTSLSKIYYQRFAGELAVQLQRSLEEELTITSAADYQYLYDTLKAYIMLSDASKMDADYFTGWCKNYWQRRYANNPAKAQYLAVQLAIVLPQGIKIKPAKQIVAAAREMLNSYNIPKEEFVYTALVKQYGQHNLVFKFIDQEIRIPKIYTIDNFAKVYNKQIPQMAYALSHKNGDWVLAGEGGVGGGSSSDEQQQNMPRGEMEKLIANLRTLYIKNYIEAWSSASQQIKIANSDDLKKMQNLVSDISNSNYPLISFLKIMQLNLTNKDAPAVFHSLVNENFNELASVDLKSIYKDVNDLAKYLSKITASDDVNKAAFNAAALRFKNAESGGGDEENVFKNLRELASRQPKPIQDWLLSLSGASWSAILLSAQNYIDAMWAANVIPEYDKVINNTYPFFKDANKSITLENFTKFFASNGVMDSFFNNYLLAFVDTEQIYWTWKKLDGQTLSLGQDKLEIFIRAALIRKMFYPNGGNTPDVQFSLAAKDLTPHTQRFSLNLGGQLISYAKGQKMIDNLVWPSRTSDLSISFINNQGGAINSTMSHDIWNWFKLLDKANFKAIDGTQRFSFIIDLNGNAVKYELDAVQPINPFIVGVINNFRCPEKL